MPAPDSIRRLVDNFGRHRDTYKSGTYNETQVRVDFINPMFEALGWDVDNKKGYAEAYRDVIHEFSLKMGATTKAPDYCFRIAQTPKFFLEAKKPAVPLKDARDAALQLRRYAWSAKLPVSILTDFDEFAVYDCRVKPDKLDSPSAARTEFWTFDQYDENWDTIASVFSKEAILQGSFDKYVESKKKKRGTAEVDEAFLAEIEHWRELLARNVNLRNKDKNLQPHELNEAVQKTIDRLIFLRICEDRGIEPYAQLLGLTSGDRVYDRMQVLYHRADERYNSGLFHFRHEKERGAPDAWTLQLEIDDKPLKEILKNLYYPDSPYEFSVLPADILGQVYEQFLGKVITPKGLTVTIEDKPEVKKAGGVYYTPTYIVDYIVEHTVGKLLEGKTPDEVMGKGRAKDAHPLRVLDPACGSGSFLIGAYQKLLDWYLAEYTKDPEKYLKGKAPRIRESGREGRAPARPASYRLTTTERKRILLDHIYGVDIDPQAVEVTKLSLLLKVLEGESDTTLNVNMQLFHERALPDLDGNIKCGNSLIGPDFYDDPENAALPEGDRRKINAFDWKTEFTEIFGGENPGFDAVIGNPPYIDIKALPEHEVAYIFRRYATSSNRINVFGTFIERAFTSLCNLRDFACSFIVPTSLLSQESYRPLRDFILSNFAIASLARLPNESFGSVAGDVKVDTVICVFVPIRGYTRTNVIAYEGYERISKIDPNTAAVSAEIDQAIWRSDPNANWSISLGATDRQILEKCETDSVKLEDCVEFCLGLTPYDKYKGHTPQQIKNRVFHSDHQKDKTFKPLLAGNDVRRYNITWNREEWIRYGGWLGAPREKRFFTEKRILVKQIIDWTSKRIWAAMTEEELYNTQNAFNLLRKPPYALEVILGVLNSRLLSYYHRKKFLDEFKMRFQKILIRDCKTFPIPRYGSGGATQSRCDQISLAVIKMIAFCAQSVHAKTPHDQSLIEREIERTDREIDRLVYELYGLTEAEIKIVEEATK